MRLNHEIVFRYNRLSLRVLGIFVVLTMVDKFLLGELFSVYLRILLAVALLFFTLTLFGLGFFEPKD